MSTLDKQKDAEDRVNVLLCDQPKLVQAIAFKYLYNLGYRIGDVDAVISAELKSQA